MSFAVSYSLEAEAEHLHCQIPGGQNIQDSKAQAGTGVSVVVGVVVEVGQAVPITTVASLVFHKLLYNERACQEWLWRRLSTPTV